jgi:hypothetical protein
MTYTILLFERNKRIKKRNVFLARGRAELSYFSLFRFPELQAYSLSNETQRSSLLGVCTGQVTAKATEAAKRSTDRMGGQPL